MKKLKGRKLKNKTQFYKLIQIKSIVIIKKRPNLRNNKLKEYFENLKSQV
jgi:hypothetical protein